MGRFVRWFSGISRVFCRHKRRRWVRNVYGDEARLGRSLWECLDCGRLVYRRQRLD